MKRGRRRSRIRRKELKNTRDHLAQFQGSKRSCEMGKYKPLKTDVRAGGMTPSQQSKEEYRIRMEEEKKTKEEAR